MNKVSLEYILPETSSPPSIRNYRPLSLSSINIALQVQRQYLQSSTSMMFSNRSMLTTLFFTALAIAYPYPLPSTDAKVSQSRNFTLSSRGLPIGSEAAAGFDGLVLEPYHIYPAFNYATLVPKTEQNKGIVGYLNGTEEELQDGIVSILPIPTGQVPFPAVRVPGNARSTIRMIRGITELERIYGLTMDNNRETFCSTVAPGFLMGSSSTKSTRRTIPSRSTLDLVPRGSSSIKGVSSTLTLSLVDFTVSSLLPLAVLSFCNCHCGIVEFL